MRCLAIILAFVGLALSAPSHAAAEAILAGVPSESSDSPASEASIPLRSPDAEIGGRLAQLYAAAEDFRGVRADVRGGIVTLSGTVLDVKARAEAENIAGRVDGVVSVTNRLEVEHRLGRRLEPLIHQAQTIGVRMLELIPLLIVALTVFALFWIAGVLFTRWTNIFHRVVRNGFIEALLEQILRLVFILVGLVVAMSILGATALIGSVLGAAGVLGLAIGFAMRDTIENYIASILLSIRQPFQPNDAVNIEGIDGRITTLNSRATIITTWDGNEVSIPNATVYKTKIRNYSRNPERRFEFEMRLDGETDLGCALAAALRATKEVEGVLAEPAPLAVLDRVENYTFVLKVLAWVDQRRSDFGKVRSETIRAVRNAFDAAGIPLGEPPQTVRQLIGEAHSESRPSAPAPAQPTHEEMRSIRDTRPDSTIDEKVRERREATENDLLTEGAPRE